jgi:hypothetical protein
MTEAAERVCAGCGDTEAQAHLEICTICHGYFCADCAVRAGFGRKFCSMNCARAFYYTGETDDDEDTDEN